MSVSDLTNTTWYFNEIIDTQDVGYEGSFKTYSLSFTSNSQTFNSISFMYDFATIKYGDTIVAEDYNTSELYRSSFTNIAYATIEITGGTDATNSTLISWLESNATQQESSGESDSSNHTHFGSTNIIKKTFGNLEIIKEVLNGTTIYEKSGGGTPSGYTLTLTATVGYFQGDIEYADGTTETIYSYGSQTYNNVVKIKKELLIFTCAHGISAVTFTPSSVADSVGVGGVFNSDYELTQDTTIFNDDGTCLDGDTLVLTKNGYAKIKDINVDTELLTYNHQTSENEYKKVSKWWHHPSSDIVIANSIKMTGDHPIYRNDYEVVKARELKKGQYFIDKDGNKIKIDNVEFSTDTIEVYMIEVEDNHNFYITKNNILTHNY